MFEVGQFVVKANTGVCRVKDIMMYSLSEEDEKKLYYSLETVGEKRGTILVPVESGKSNVRPVMSRDEAEDLMRQIPLIHALESASERLREQEYRDTIKQNQPELLVGMIKSLYLRSREREAAGKKATAVDERYSKMAESVLFAEVSLVLGKEEDEIRETIRKYSV